MPSTKLLIIDNHDDVREALETRLDAVSGIEVVGCTGCWKTGLQEAKSLRPDVVLLETKRTDDEGLEALCSLTEECPHTSIVVLTSYAEADERAEALQEGAARYLLKDIDTSQLVRQIQDVVRPQAMI